MSSTIFPPSHRKPKTFLKYFATENQAMEFMAARNRTARLAGNRKDLLVVTDGPEDNFAVMDVATAIEMEMPYRWEAR